MIRVPAISLDHCRRAVTEAGFTSRNPAAERLDRMIHARECNLAHLTQSYQHSRPSMTWLQLIHRIPPEPGYLRVKGVDPDVCLPAAGEMRFDLHEAAFTHQGDRCTFALLCALVAPDDGALRAVAETVHDVDLADGKSGRAELAGIERLIGGIQAAATSDEERVAHAAEVVEALFRSSGGAAG
jgi:hypothetical protein